MAWSFYLGAIIYISLSNSETFALAIVGNGKTCVIVATLVVGLSVYWLKLSHAELLRTMTTLTGIVLAIWIVGSKDGDVMHALVFNAVVHNTSMLVIVAASDRHDRPFSAEWIHATVTAPNEGLHMSNRFQC